MFTIRRGLSEFWVGGITVPHFKQGSFRFDKDRNVFTVDPPKTMVQMASYADASVTLELIKQSVSAKHRLDLDQALVWEMEGGIK